MSQTVAASSRFQDIFNAALKLYEKQTKKDLIAHPLTSQLQVCDSPTAILSVLQEKAREFDQARSGDERLTKWLNPTINVFSPAKVVFAGICVFLLVNTLFIPAAKDVAASQDAVADLFEQMEFFFKRLEAYTEVAPTAAMTDIITKIMVEVLTIFGTATKEIKQGRGKKFLKKLAGRTGIEDALRRLDRLTQEEARMALAEVLKITHTIREVVINDGTEAKMTAMELKLITQQTESGVDEIKWNQLQQLLRTWLSPSDPSINHNVALNAQHKGTAIWFFQSGLFIEWKSTGSLLWIHGKPGSGKSIIWFVIP
ncbi:hypothetical protein EDB87DRAFT_1576007 [Lactarius vividus]|nr:hypothetical protein EDB87DRAFT_1576007 [Lactarius vividus]